MEATLYKEMRVILLFTMMVVMSGVEAQLVMTSPSEYSDFCTRTLAMKACPTPPTIDNVDLRTFLGSYYEVGATARYKLRSELGMVCPQANFSVESLPPPTDQSSVVTIDVQNSGVQVMGLQSISALSEIAYSAADVCGNAARMCAIMAPGSKLAEALLRMGAVEEQISDSLPSDAATLGQASAILNSSIAGVQSCLDGLARSVNTIARISAELNQAVGPLDPLLRALRTTVALGGQEVRDLGSIAIGNLTLARSLINEAASHNIADAGSVELLSEASILIEQEIELVTSQVTKVQGLLISIGGPLADMIAADRSATNATASLVITSGQAIQNPDQRGNMALKSKETTQPYQIIALEGLPTLGYSSILIYSCQPDSNGDPRGDLFLLSRTPTLPAQTVTNLLGIASSHGIYTDCDSAFVPTVQRGGDCGAAP